MIGKICLGVLFFIAVQFLNVPVYAEIDLKEPFIGIWPIRYSRIFDLDYDNVSIEKVINDLNKKYKLALTLYYYYEKRRRMGIPRQNL